MSFFKILKPSLKFYHQVSGSLFYLFSIMRLGLTNSYLNCDPPDAGEQVFCFLFFLKTHESSDKKVARPLPTSVHTHTTANKLDGTQWYINLLSSEDLEKAFR